MAADLGKFGLAVFRENSGALVWLLLIAFFLLCYLFSTIRYCSPCNRKRGRFQTLCPACGKRLQTISRRCS